jgi:hypothetical protein
MPGKVQIRPDGGKGWLMAWVLQQSTPDFL